MSHFIEFHFFFLRAYFLKPFVLLQYGLLLSLPLVPYVGTIASWSPRYPLSCFLFPVSLKNTSMEESRHPHVRVGEAAAGGDPWASLTGRLQCCLQAAGCTFAGKSPGTCRLRYVPWSYALSLEENSLALCLLAYVQQSEPEHVAKRGVGDLMPFIWTCLQISTFSAVPLSYHTGSAAPLSDLWSLWKKGNHLAVQGSERRGRGWGGRGSGWDSYFYSDSQRLLPPSAPQRTILKYPEAFYSEDFLRLAGAD